MNATNNFVLKVLTIGESGVGKTCILLRFCDNRFINPHLTTIGIDYKIKNFMVGDKSVKLKIWDTAGQERFRNITNQYYKNADGIILVFDLSDRGSFERIRDWISQIQNAKDKDQVSVILVGNKCDITDRQVSRQEGEALANEFKLTYFESSALNNYNIEEIFRELSLDIIKRKESENEHSSNTLATPTTPVTPTIPAENETKTINLNDPKMKDAEKAIQFLKEKKCC